MSNRALLLAADSPEPPADYEPAHAILGANYSAPLLWLSLFDATEIVSWPSTLDSTRAYAAVVGRRDPCLARTRSRIARWNAQWPRTFHDIGPAWLDFISARRGQFFAIWTEELAEMADSNDEWLRTFTSYLETLDDPAAPSFAEVLAQSYLTIDPDGTRLVGTSDDPLLVLAAGHSWAVHAPWE
jgi:hypothetical protein